VTLRVEPEALLLAGEDFTTDPPVRLVRNSNFDRFHPCGLESAGFIAFALNEWAQGLILIRNS
jgi:hypothetical protein